MKPDEAPAPVTDEEKAAAAEKIVAEKKEASETGASQTSMKIKVYSPSRTYFEGEGASISAESATGPFDILPKHHNFITLLTACDLIVRGPGGDQTFKISNGIMHVKANQVTVFLDV